MVSNLFYGNRKEWETGKSRQMSTKTFLVVKALLKMGFMVRYTY